MKARFHEYRFDFLHLLALCAFSIAQPVYDVLGQHPDFFLVRRSTALDIWLLVAVISACLPALLLVIHAAAIATGKTARDVSYNLIVVLLGAVLLLPLLNHKLGLSVFVTLPVAIAFGVGLAFAVWKWQRARSFLNILAIATIVFPLFFLAFSPVYRVASAVEASAAAQTMIDEDAPPIVLIVFDELPTISLMNEQLGIDSIRYPNFAELAQTSTWYRDTTTVNKLTDQAMPAILTGRYSDSRGAELADFNDVPENLFSLLAGRYELHSFEIVTRLCPPAYCGEDVMQEAASARARSLLRDTAIVALNIYLPLEIKESYPWIQAELHAMHVRAQRDGGDTQAAIQGLIRTYGAEMLAGATYSADWRVYQYERFLETINERNGQLYVLHSMFPHLPFRFTSSGNIYTDHPGLPGWRVGDDMWVEARAPVEVAHRRHLMQLGYTDRLLGLLFKRLRDQGIFDRALIIVTSDHGISFRPGLPRRDPTEGTFHEIVNVPLFVKYPGQRSGNIDDRPAQTIDIVPTVADVLGVEDPWDFDGFSLRSADEHSVRSFEAVDFESDISGLSPPLERQTRLFGTGSDGLFDPGPRPDLIGKTPTAVRVAGNGCTATIQGPSLRTREPNSDRLPVLVSGQVECESTTEGLVVAISVNNVVVSTAPVYPGIDGELRFDTILKEESVMPLRVSFDAVVVD